jgi:hypothetical protein
LYGCETWLVTLKEKHRLRIFDNRMLGGLFGPEREDVMVGLIRVDNEKLHNLYSSPNIVRVIKSWRMKWAGHVEYMHNYIGKNQR